MESVLIAIGGNALYDKKSGNNLCPNMVREVCTRIVEVYKSGYLPVITFGNGPQVGNLLDMAETSARLFATPVTLDTCVSWTQGEIGYWLTRELTKQLQEQGFDKPVMALNTLVEVNPDDPAFQKPSKPVGKFIDAEEAQKLYEERGWIVGPDANRGYRRMVPSPRPLRILEAEPINHLIRSGYIVMACGGGGIPVYKKDGVFQGIEAVIDKDFTSCLLAKTLKIENLIICTEVENVYLNFGKPDQQALRRLSLADAEQYQAEGHFGAGSMGPKVAAMIDYVRHGGKRAFITSLEKVVEALAGNAGTEIHATDDALISG
jgi:carbamate kinase